MTNVCYSKNLLKKSFFFKVRDVTVSFDVSSSSLLGFFAMDFKVICQVATCCAISKEISMGQCKQGRC